MMMASSELRDVGSILARFQHLLNDVYRAELGLIGNRFLMRLHPSGSVRSPVLARLSIGSWAWHSRWLTGRSDLVFDASFTSP